MEIRKRNNVHVIDAIRPDAPVLVYAHGLGCSQHMWRHITPAFEGKCRQVLFDYVGCGQSDLAAFDPVKYASLKGSAHSGGTDSQGCHLDHKTGMRHCH
ncbi:YHYH domain-containing protein [Acidovorax delafieldii]|uniref:YHYH domain-containing protein n=1 Tax=Acidovorax delafieldii TaxID=47920 RepID=UPI003ECC5789